MFYPELLNIVKPLSKGHSGDSINSAVVSLVEGMFSSQRFNMYKTVGKPTICDLD